MPKFIRLPEKSIRNLFWFPLFLFLYSFIGNVSNDIYMPSMPILVHVFNTNDHWVQLTLHVVFRRCSTRITHGACRRSVWTPCIIILGWVCISYSQHWYAQSVLISVG